MRTTYPIPKSTMTLILEYGMTLKGRLSSYRLVRDIYRSVDDGAVYLAK